MNKYFLSFIVLTAFTFFGFSREALAGFVPYSSALPYVVDGGAPVAITVTLTAVPDTMTLPTNQTRLTWSTTGSPDSCTATNNGWWSGNKSANATQFEDITGLTAGSHLFEITCVKAGYANASDTALVVVNNGGAPSGTLSAVGCTIAANASSCGSTVSWTTANLTVNPTAITRNTGSPASFTPSPLAGGTQATTLGYGQTDFYLYHNAVLLAQSSATASCAGGTTWNGSICQVNPPAPTASLTANPTSIPLGNSSTLTWSSTNATSCSGFGFNTGGATSGSLAVSPASTTTYTVSCTGAGGTTDANATVTVTGAPQPECSDGIDNDGDGVKDANDPGCYTNGVYDPNDTSELNKRKSIFKEF